MLKVFESYSADVRAGEFPAVEHTYKMIDGELDKLKDLRKK